MMDNSTHQNSQVFADDSQNSFESSGNFANFGDDSSDVFGNWDNNFEDSNTKQSFGNNSTSVEQYSATSSADIWDTGGQSTPVSNGINANDIWGSSGSSSNNDIWGTGEEISNAGGGNGSFANFDQSSETSSKEPSFVNPLALQKPKKFNLSYKTVGLICAGVFLVIALVLGCLQSIKVTSKDSNQQSSGTTQQVQTAQTASSPQQTVSDGGISLILIPDSTFLDDSGDIFEASGVIDSKVRYLDGHQVIYCIKIKISLMGESKIVDYFCSYGIYKQLSEGQLLTIKYQNVSDGFMHVLEVSK